MPNVMLWNDAGKRFLDVTKVTRTGHVQKGHGVAFADWDGDEDLYHRLGGFYRVDKAMDVLFLNPGHGLHNVTLSFAGTESNHHGIGARITVEIDTPSGPRKLHRAQCSVSSFGGSPISRM